ncbi:MAG: AIR synthase family protein [Acidilobus sp.]|nr:AIR synthase family protein [Acidilobus sp.]MCG2889975.1 AIR synthase family protein [Acidilobus sp.]MCG2891452.1 AIR synthase family protein [Acidilobus sp.]
MAPPVIGKVNRELFERVIFPNLGAEDASVIVGPQFGVDFGVVRVGDYDLIFEVDPVYVVPEYGWEKSAWFAVHILASDVAVSGVPPRYLFIDLNLPLRMTDEELERLWRAIHNECRRLGITIVAGHTGRYGGIDYPMIGGAVMVGVTKRDHFVTPAMARPGDVVIMTKGAAVETAGILASMFPEVLERRYGKEFARRAQEIFWLQSVVDDALTLAQLGLRDGVTAMHDATEYGVWGALNDVAEASGVSIRVFREKLFVRDDVMKVLEAFSELTGIKVDPFASISEGTLIATVRRGLEGRALELLRSRGIEAAVIGEVVEGKGVYLVDDGSERLIRQPEQDPFWPLFFRALEMVRGHEGG